jgi:hemerythrin-like domain-containing protein
LTDIKGNGAGLAILACNTHLPGDTMHQVSQVLDNEHRSSLDLLGRVEQAFVRAHGAAGFTPLAPAFIRLIEHEISRHFEFEEGELFTRMTEAGEGDIAGLLRDEHDAIRAVAAELLPLARTAAAGSLDECGWVELRRGVLEMVERQVAHIQKESMALLPMLDDHLLDDDTDSALALAYSSN